MQTAEEISLFPMFFFYRYYVHDKNPQEDKTKTCI